jgi:hypothetical protein
MVVFESKYHKPSPEFLVLISLTVTSEAFYDQLNMSSSIAKPVCRVTVNDVQFGQQIIGVKTVSFTLREELGQMVFGNRML